MSNTPDTDKEWRHPASFDGSEKVVHISFTQKLERELYNLQAQNMKLKFEVAAVKNKLAEVISIARQGRYLTMDFIAVGKRLDAMDDYLANNEAISHPKYGGTELL